MVKRSHVTNLWLTKLTKPRVLKIRGTHYNEGIFHFKASIKMHYACNCNREVPIGGAKAVSISDSDNLSEKLLKIKTKT